jgi:hypothetical protein
MENEEKMMSGEESLKPFTAYPVWKATVIGYVKVYKDYLSVELE